MYSKYSIYNREYQDPINQKENDLKTNLNNNSTNLKMSGKPPACYQSIFSVRIYFIIFQIEFFIF